MRGLAWFQIVVGAAMAALWTVLVVAGEVPEIPAGQLDIYFHLAAELITAGLLVAAGTTLLRRGLARGRLLSAFALGALLYTTVNSPGYYADLGEWAPVVMFGALAAVTAGLFVRLILRATTDTEHTEAHPPVPAGRA